MGGNGLASGQGRREVQFTSASAEQAGLRHPVGRRLQGQLDAKGREARVGVEQQCHRAAHDGRRLAGAAQRHVGGLAGAGHAVGAGQGQGRAHDAGGRNQAARGGEVGLDDVVDLRGAARAPRGQRVVGVGRSAVGAHGAHGDHVGRVTGRGDAAHHRLAVGRLADVAGRCHDHDAGAHRALHRLVERVVAEALGDGRAERHVDDADVELGAVLDGPVHGLDHVAHEARSVVAEHAQVDEVGARRHAGVALAAAGVDGVARHDAGDVRAVTVAVEAAATIAVPREVHAGDHLAVQRAVRRDARVDDGHADALAVHRAERRHHAVQGGVGAGGLGRERHLRAHDRVRRHGRHVGVGGERVELPGRHLEHRAALQPLLQLQRVPGEHAADGRVVAIDDHFHRGAVTCAKLGGEVCRHPGTALGAGNRGRCHREGDEDGERTEGHGQALPNPGGLAGDSVLVLREEGVDDDPLRTAARADGLQDAFADAVVDRAARHAENLRGTLDGHAAPELGEGRSGQILGSVHVELRRYEWQGRCQAPEPSSLRCVSLDWPDVYEVESTVSVRPA